MADGQTVGARIGQTTFMPGRGIRVENFNSFVEYRLPQTVTSGQFSMIVDVATRTSGDKTKLFAMYDGGADIITSRWRATLDKRNDGTVTWRFYRRRARNERTD